MNIAQIKEWRNSPQLEMIFGIKCSYYGTEQTSFGTIIDTLLEEINHYKELHEQEIQLADKRLGEAQRYKNVLIGQGFENLDSLVNESRDTTQIGIVAKQRTEQIILERDELIAENDKLWAIINGIGVGMYTEEESIQTLVSGLKQQLLEVRAELQTLVGGTNVTIAEARQEVASKILKMIERSKFWADHFDLTTYQSLQTHFELLIKAEFKLEDDE